MQVLPDQKRGENFIVLHYALIESNSLELGEPYDNEGNCEEFVQKVLNFEGFGEPAIQEVESQICQSHILRFKINSQLEERSLISLNLLRVKLQGN